MLEKKIIFSAQEDYVNLKEDYPIPAKLNIPDWFKSLKHDFKEKTVKGCIPFLDSLTAGYILKMPQDMHIDHNVINPDGKPDSYYRFAMGDFAHYLAQNQINLNSGMDAHPKKQLGECPFHSKNKNLPYYKILNPWTIKTPPGYSCLFVPPLNNSDDRFSIIPGIVDTDTFPNEINFPFIINGDKYPQLHTMIKKGTPYVQIIPFKRDRWKMDIKSSSTKELASRHSFYGLKLQDMYKNTYWNKKSWK